MEEIVEFIKKYKYPIIGGIIALLLLVTDLFQVLKVIVVIALGIYLGFYVQKNKETIKEKLRKLIDKM
ncbi:MAG: DUF2273 domain-containing protein [Clostridia bacterium]|nr:DUF2273 domain-containing protein [Clostridia bacterium]